MAACAKYRPLLLACPGIRGVTAGVKHSAGRYHFTTNNGSPIFSVIVAVEKKKKSIKPGHVGFIPTELDGVPTDVVKWRPRPKVRAHGNGGATPPALVGGTEIELIHADQTSGGKGTLSTVVRDENSSQLFGLTNAHVAFGRKLQFQNGDRIRSSPGGQVIGIPERNGFEPPYNQYGVIDAGAIALDGDHSKDRGNVYPHRKLPIAGIGQITAAGVEQCGARTAKTQTGRFLRIEESAEVEFDKGFSRVLDNLIRIEPGKKPFGVPGDSGAILVGKVYDDFVAVGLYVGIDTKTQDGLAMILEDVLDRMNLVF